MNFYIILYYIYVLFFYTSWSGQNSPDAVEDEEQLNEDASEGQDATHHDPWEGFGVKRLLWNLTRDLIGAYGMFDALRHTETTNN